MPMPPHMLQKIPQQTWTHWHKWHRHPQQTWDIPQTKAHIQELANKDANFVIQLYHSPAIFTKYLLKDINKFITKIATQHKLPTYIFQQ